MKQQTGSSATAALAPGTLDLRLCYTERPPELDFVAKGLLGGTVAVLASPGGTGKSWCALMLAHAVAAADVPGADPLRLLPDSPTAGPVLYLSLEDPSVVLRHRLWRCAQLYPADVLDRCVERLTIQDATGTLVDIMRDDHLDALARVAEQMRLIVVDTLARSHGGDENDNAVMTAVLRRFELVAARTGAAVLLVHHVKKSGGKERDANADVVRGASAIVNSARAVIAIAKHPKAASIRSLRAADDASVELDPKTAMQISFLKCNYASFPEPIDVARGPGGVLVRCAVEPRDPESRGKASHRVQVVQ